MAGVSVLKDVCVVGATTHALLDARSMLDPARLLAATADDAARSLSAAANDLTVAAAAADHTSLGAAAVDGVRSSLAAAQRAPDFCRDHALDVVRGQLTLTLAEHAAAHVADAGATGALASTRSALLRASSVLGGGAALGARGAQLALGAAVRRDAVTVDRIAAAAERCFHETPVANRAPYHLGGDVTATEALLAAPSAHRITASRSDGRTARNALAEVFAPLVHDLTTHARALREAPLDRIPLAGAEPVVTKPQRALEVLGNTLPVDERLLGRSSRFDRILSSRTKAIDVATQLDVPIGEHGMPLARALVDAGRAMDAIILTRMAAQIDEVGAANWELLQSWTFQRAHLDRAMLEGITSIGHVVSVLTSRRVEGMDEFQVLEALDRGHAIDRIAKGPMGFIAPIVRHGLDVRVPLEIGRRGEAKLGSDLDQLLRDTIEHRRTHRAPARTTHAGCPVSLLHLTVKLADGRELTARRTPLAELAGEYLHLAGRYLRRELDGS